MWHSVIEHNAVSRCASQGRWRGVASGFRLLTSVFQFRSSSQWIALVLLTAFAAWAGGPGFRSQRQFEEHYQKHGSEFGKVTKAQYLQFAQDFRDMPKGTDVLEVVRADGVMTRFHRRKGWFIAVNRDRTIRTFFIPTDGERYFRRQAARPD